jgi:hypothetical protein
MADRNSSSDAERTHDGFVISRTVKYTALSSATWAAAAGSVISERTCSCSREVVRISKRLNLTLSMGVMFAVFGGFLMGPSSIAKKWARRGPHAETSPVGPNLFQRDFSYSVTASRS